jgi:hypothetical protein
MPPAAVAWHAVTRPGAGGLEDGFDFLHATEETPLDAGGVRLTWARANSAMTPLSPRGCTCTRRRAPRSGARSGPARPATATGRCAPSGRGAMLARSPRSATSTGRLARSQLLPDGAVRVTRANGDADVHRPPAAGDAGVANAPRTRRAPVSEVTLAGWRRCSSPVSQRTPPPPPTRPRARASAGRRRARVRARSRGLPGHRGNLGRGRPPDGARRAGPCAPAGSRCTSPCGSAGGPGSCRPAPTTRSITSAPASTATACSSTSRSPPATGRAGRRVVARAHRAGQRRRRHPDHRTRATADAVTPAASWAEGPRAGRWISRSRSPRCVTGRSPPARAHPPWCSTCWSTRRRRPRAPPRPARLGGLTSPASAPTWPATGTTRPAGLRLALPPG